MSVECEGKSSWPELVGECGNVAVATVERENPFVTAIILTPETLPTADFLCDRVWVHVDDNDNVTQIPRIGKGSWPELVGECGNIAVTTIESENPLVTAIILPPRNFPITDYRCDRVWVYVDDNGNVTRVPKVG